MKESTQELAINENNMSSHTHYDVIIAGGGLSGCLTALSLLQVSNKEGKALSIAIVEANANSNIVDTSQPNPSVNPANNKKVTLTNAFDERVIALSHSTVNYFKALGVWEYLANEATPINTIHISDRGHYGKARIYAHEHNVEALGYVAEMKSIGASFQQSIQQQIKINNDLKIASSIDWFCPDSISNISWQKTLVKVSLTSNQQLSASLLLACDGAHSVCRTFANIKSTQKAYEQSAVIANVRMHGIANANTLTENIAYERFTEFGPIAMLPLGHHRYSLVWTVTPEQADCIASYTDHEFIEAINHAFGLWEGGVSEVGTRTTFPLQLVEAESNVYHRMALIGNASHTIHPIAGQGFNLGVRDVKQLSELIAKQLANDRLDCQLEGPVSKHLNPPNIDQNNLKQKSLSDKNWSPLNGDVGASSLLNRYDQLRNSDQQHIITLTDSLVSLFSNTHTPLVAGRNVALKAMNYITPIKQRFVIKSMGY